MFPSLCHSLHRFLFHHHKIQEEIRQVKHVMETLIFMLGGLGLIQGLHSACPCGTVFTHHAGAEASSCLGLRALKITAREPDYCRVVLLGLSPCLSHS